MLRTLRIDKYRFGKIVIAVSALLMTYSGIHAQNCSGLYPNPKGTRVPGPIPGTNNFYTGHIAYKPVDYDANPTKKYPVIIYFAGYGAQGTGSMGDLCNIIIDQHSQPGDPPSHLIDRIERGTWGANIVPTVGSTSFLVIAVQYNRYGNTGFNYPNQTDALIDYIVNTYRVDESRIYLTGMSTGSNMVIDYLASSQEHASRIAAASMPALCLPLDYVSPQGPANVAAGDVATWFIQCADEVPEINPFVNPVCVLQTATNWDSAINSHNPTTAPRLTILANLPHPYNVEYPERYNWCQSYGHDAWRAAHAQDFVPTSGPGPNLYEWLLQYQKESALPIVLKSFTARLSDGKVYLRWVTTAEQDNASFTIERSNGNGAWTAIGTLPGSGTTSSERIYDYVDENPLTNLSFYRIKQTDVNGRERYYDARKIMNKGRFKNMVIVTPNPFSSDPSAFINVDKKQRVSIWLTDMSGRVLSTVNGTFEEGTTELSLPANSLPRGVYFIKVKGANISETHKIIKQ